MKSNNYKITFIFGFLFLTTIAFVGAQTKEEYAKLIKEQQAIDAQKQATIPKENIAKHIQTIGTSGTIITALATANKPVAFDKINSTF